MLADAQAFTGPELTLTAVDLGDTPGQPAVVPCAGAGLLADIFKHYQTAFSEHVEVSDAKPWWTPVDVP